MKHGGIRLSFLHPVLSVFQKTAVKLWLKFKYTRIFLVLVGEVIKHDLADVNGKTPTNCAVVRFSFNKKIIKNLIHNEGRKRWINPSCVGGVFPVLLTVQCHQNKVCPYLLYYLPLFFTCMRLNTISPHIIPAKRVLSSHCCQWKLLRAEFFWKSLDNILHKK